MTWAEENRPPYAKTAVTFFFCKLHCWQFETLWLYGLFGGIHLVDGIEFSGWTELVVYRGTQQALFAVKLHAVEWWMWPCA